MSVPRFLTFRPLASLAAIAATLGAAAVADAATVSSPFRLIVNLEPPASCNWETANRMAGQPQQVKVVCGNTRSAPGTDTRYLLHVYRAGEWLGVIDSDMGSGTITTWRVVRAANRDYLEIMVGW